MRRFRQSFLNCAVIILILTGCATSKKESSPKQQVLDFAMNTFGKIRDVLEPGDKTGLKVKFVGSHIEVTSEHWTYVLDNSGHQIFRPVATLLHIEPSFSNDIGPVLNNWLEQPVPQNRIDEAKRLALSTLGVNYMGDEEIRIFPTRELIASRPIDSISNSETVKYYEGRTMVLFRPKSFDESVLQVTNSSMIRDRDGQPQINSQAANVSLKPYETAVTFAPGGKVIRIESTYQTAEVREIAAVFFEALKRGIILGEVYEIDPDMRFRGFFDPEEYRFEVTVHSYESEAFLNPQRTAGCTPGTYADSCNPYFPCYPHYPYMTKDKWWCSDAAGALSFDDYKETYHYKYWSWRLWFEKGLKNGIRGNCSDYDAGNQSCLSWEYDFNVMKPKDLESYSVVESIVDKYSKQFCDGVPYYDAPKGCDFTLEDQFFQDLEWSHIAAISTHGGPLPSGRGTRDVYQFRIGYDRWAKLHDEGSDGLGKGRLRHLFLETCSSMNWIWAPQCGHPKNIDSDWMNGHIADGIRTVCGHDGASFGWHWNGWRFFGNYNLGDSISQAWFGARFQPNHCNVPVVIAYGSTEEEAAAILLDGRFTKTRGGTGWVVVSEMWIIAPWTQAVDCHFLDGFVEKLPHCMCIDKGGEVPD